MKVAGGVLPYPFGAESRVTGDKFNQTPIFFVAIAIYNMTYLHVTAYSATLHERFYNIAYLHILYLRARGLRAGRGACGAG